MSTVSEKGIPFICFFYDENEYLKRKFFVKEFLSKDKMSDSDFLQLCRTTCVNKKRKENTILGSVEILSAIFIW